MANASVSDLVRHGDNITVECEGNYELAAGKVNGGIGVGIGSPDGAGQRTDFSPGIVCNNGTWSKIPRCEPARCKTLPPPPLNGMVVVSALENI